MLAATFKHPVFNVEALNIERRRRTLAPRCETSSHSGLRGDRCSIPGDSRQARRPRPTSAFPRRTGWSSASRRQRAMPARRSWRRAATPSTRRSPRPSRWRSRIPSAGNIGGGGFMIVRTPAGKATTFDYRERAPLKSTPTMYLGADGKIDRSADGRRLSGAGRAGHGARPGAGAQEVRQAAVEGRRRAGGRARRRIHDVGEPRAQPQSRNPGSDGAVPRVARGIRQARRRRLGRRRSARSVGSREDAARDCQGRSECVLQRLDRRSHRRGHEGQRRPHLERGPRGLQGAASARRFAAPTWATRSSRCRRRAPAASR